MCQYDNKIAIIIARKNDGDFNTLIQSLQKSDIPPGMDVEIIPIVDYMSCAEAYAYATHNLGAKYKIYIREDCKINDRGLLQKVIEKFKQEPCVGAIGVSGTKVIPTHLDCRAATKRAGMVDVEGEGVKKWECTDEDIDVAVLDDYFFATQYDIPWDEELLASDYLSFLAYGTVIRMRGYKLKLLHQDKPCLSIKYTTNNDDFDFDTREIFLDRYSKEIFPLVTVLLQTHNRPKMFEEALNSVLNQTYRNLEVVISDNSDDDDTQNLIQAYIKRDHRIKYFRNKGFSVYENTFFLCEYNNLEAEYVNWLADDDGFYPEKLTKEINIYLENDNISLVTSYRKLIDGQGRILQDAEFNIPPCPKTSIIDAKSAARYLIVKRINFIGEQSTVLIKKSFLKLARPIYEKKHNLHSKYLMQCWKCGDEIPLMRGDYPMWLYLLDRGDMVYIKEPLAWFRIHEDQMQKSDEIANRQELLSWAWCMVQGYRKGIVEDVEVPGLITKWFTEFADIINGMKGFRFKEDMWVDELYQLSIDMLNWLYKEDLPKLSYLLSDYVYDDEYFSLEKDD